MTIYCPKHNTPMLPYMTQWGAMHVCRIDGCTMLKWGDSDRTSPADAPTRARRHAAHEIFDKLWQGGHMARGEAYQQLSGHLDKHIKETHIGLFDIYECEATIEFANKTQMRILLEKFD